MTLCDAGPTNCLSPEAAEGDMDCAGELAFLYVTQPQPCPYLPGRVERKIVTPLVGVEAGAEYERLIESGFRRSHMLVYKPACPSCRACVPTRVVADRFSPTASLRRVAKVNADLSIRHVSPHARPEHYDLFRGYQRSRHKGGEMASMDFGDYRAMIEDSAIVTRLAEFRDRDGGLAAVCLYDQLQDALSAVYTFFDPNAKRRSLGTFMILWMIERARSLGFRYVYLGYWIEACANMDYKKRFHPLETLTPEGWRPLPR